LYGLIFVDAKKIEFERGLGIFVKTSLGLPDSFPHVVAAALLGVKQIQVFQMEQRLKFLLRWEEREKYPVFESLLLDRCTLFPIGVGLNARLGDVLALLGELRTVDYREHHQAIITTTTTRCEHEHRERLLATEGRAFWTKISPDGNIPVSLKQVLARLSFESFRIIVLLLADMLCWTSLKKPTRSCPTCKAKFTTAHFFSCPKFFHQNAGWLRLIRLCREESWEDVVDYIFDILRRWVNETVLFRSTFRLYVLEFEQLCGDVVHAAFRFDI
jgi:hypothetical protein